MIAQNLLAEVEKFSDYKIKEKEDLQKILELCIQQDENLLDELSFTAKYVNGLMRVMQKIPGIQEVNDFGNIEKDLAENINKISAKLKQILSSADLTLTKNFEEKYFRIDQNSFQNFKSLLNDLEWIKIYLNARKRGELK